MSSDESTSNSKQGERRTNHKLTNSTRLDRYDNRLDHSPGASRDRPSGTQNPYWYSARGRGIRSGSSSSGQSPYSSRYRSDMSIRPPDIPLRILVSSEYVGAVIGRNGGTIREITQASHARVDVHRRESANALEKVITIHGTPEACSAACGRIMQVVADEAKSLNKSQVPLKILVPINLIGRIIGKNGSTIKRTSDESGCEIQVNTYLCEKQIVVRGPLENMSKAEQLISEKVRKCIENDVAASANYYGASSGGHGPGGSGNMYPPPYHHLGPQGMYGGGPPPPPPHHGHHGRGSGSGGPGGSGTWPSSPSSSSWPHSALAGYPLSPMNPFAPHSPFSPSMHPSHSSSGAGISPMSVLGPALVHGAAGFGLGGLDVSSSLTLTNTAQAAQYQQLLNQRETIQVFVPSSCASLIKGSLRELASISGAQAKMQPAQQQDKSSSSTSLDSAFTERKVSVTGRPDGQYRAQYMLYNLVGNPNSTVLRVEMDIPVGSVKFLVGRKGAKIREVQTLTGANIKLLTSPVRPAPADDDTSGAAAAAATPAAPSPPVESADDTDSPDSTSSPSRQEESGATSTRTGAAASQPVDVFAPAAVQLTGNFFSTYTAQRNIRSIVARYLVSNIAEKEGKASASKAAAGSKLNQSHKPSTKRSQPKTTGTADSGAGEATSSQIDSSENGNYDDEQELRRDIENETNEPAPVSTKATTRLSPAASASPAPAAAHPLSNGGDETTTNS